jgi:hypothetical protein
LFIRQNEKDIGVSFLVEIQPRLSYVFCHCVDVPSGWA